MTTEFFDTFVLMLGYFIVMFIVDYKVSILSLMAIILSILFSHLMRKRIYFSGKEYKEYVSKNKDITLNMLKNELY